MITRVLRLPAPEDPSIQVVGSPEELPPALTYESLPEEIPLKTSVLARLGYNPEEHGLLTGTSSFSPREIHPAAVGLHFFNPIHALAFAEVGGVSPDLPPLVHELLGRLSAAGLTLVHTESNRGYVGNYILFREIATVLKLIDDHRYTTASIDLVQRKMGRQVSLFDIVDIVGVDVTLRIIQNLREQDASIHLSPRLLRAVELGVLGRKNNTSIRQLLDGGTSA